MSETKPVTPPTPPVVVASPMTVEQVINKARIKAQFYAAFSGKALHNPYYYLHPLEEICDALNSLSNPTQEQILSASKLIDDVGEKDAATGKLLPPHQDNLKIPGIIVQQKSVGIAEAALKKSTEVPAKPIVPVQGLGKLVNIQGVTHQ